MSNLQGTTSYNGKSLARVTANYQAAYPDPLIIKAGEALKVGRNDTEWPGFVWCATQNNKAGWVPERYIEREGEVGLARYDYDATELSVRVGDVLTIHNVESGWLWCMGQDNQNGWVPLKHVKIISTLAYLLEEQAASPFDFETTAQAHGWVALRPFGWDESTPELSRVQQLTSSKVVNLRMQAGSDESVAVETRVETVEPLTPDERAEIRQGICRMLRLDENLGEFYQLCDQMTDWTLSLQPGGGRLLRCPTLFEDIIYTLCTTNIAWSGTIRMVDHLTATLGHAFPGNDDQRAFPTPEIIAAAGPELLKQKTGLGYRSPYVWELATSVAEGRLDLKDFEDPSVSTKDLHQALCQIKGIGNYAAATILMLLGRYEHLAIDSELRAFVSKKYFNGRRPTDDQIQKIYAPWGRWQYLAYWFDSES